MIFFSYNHLFLTKIDSIVMHWVQLFKFDWEFFIPSFGSCKNTLVASDYSLFSKRRLIEIHKNGPKYLVAKTKENYNNFILKTIFFELKDIITWLARRDVSLLVGNFHHYLEIKSSTHQGGRWYFSLFVRLKEKLKPPLN